MQSICRDWILRTADAIRAGRPNVPSVLFACNVFPLLLIGAMFIGIWKMLENLSRVVKAYVDSKQKYE